MGVRQRIERFQERYRMRLPVVQAPMAGACPPELAVAVAEAGGMGAAGVVLDPPEGIADWVARFRAGSDGPFQLNLWIPDEPTADAEAARRGTEAAREFLGRFGPPGEPAGAGPAFADQCAAILAAAPPVVSSIMGLYPPEFVRELGRRGIAWFACATTLDEALAAQEAGADAIVAQGLEAGGHRGTFDPDAAERTSVGLFALLPRLADHLRIPIVATGGIADGRGVAAALTLGASAVQVGTTLLRSPEAGIGKAWSSALDGLAPEATVTTRAYSGRLGRAAPSPFLSAWAGPDAPPPARYPDQRGLVARWRRGLPPEGSDGAPTAPAATGGPDSRADGPDSAPPRLDRANHWAGQSAALAREEPAGAVVDRLWREADTLLPG
jgi:nitronate monooxygenase